MAYKSNYYNKSTLKKLAFKLAPVMPIGEWRHVREIFDEMKPQIMEKTSRSYLGALCSFTEYFENSRKSDVKSGHYRRTKEFNRDNFVFLQSIEEETKKQKIEQKIPDKPAFGFMFGKFWDKKILEDKKTKKSKFQGRDTNGDIIDLDSQTRSGIYLLHRHGKVVYVGQTDKGIANRASDHLVKKFKWDEFSWFTVPKEQLDMVESMLIEVLQPWENDQRGRGIPEAEIEQP